MFRKRQVVTRVNSGELLAALEELFDAEEAVGEAAEWRDWESIELYLHDEEREASERVEQLVSRVRDSYQRGGDDDV